MRKRQPRFPPARCARRTPRSPNRITARVEASGLRPLIVGLKLAFCTPGRPDGIETALCYGKTVALVPIAGLLVGSLPVSRGQVRLDPSCLDRRR